MPLNKNVLNGKFVVDIKSYNESIVSYLIRRGASESDVPFQWRENTKFKIVCYDGCKPTYISKDGSARIFFPNEDEAKLFIYAHGETITSSYIKSISDILNT